MMRDSELLLRSIKLYPKLKTRQDLLKAEVDRIDDILGGLMAEKETVTSRFDSLIATRSGDRIKSYIHDFEEEIERINTETSKLEA